MASIERRERNGSTTWRVKWRDPDGRQRSQVFDRERAAKDHRATIERSLVTSTYIDADRGRIPMGEWVELWFASKLGIKASTRERYRGILDTHVLPHWSRTPLTKVTHSDIQKWVAGIDRAPDTVHKTFRVLSMALDFAVADGRLGRNPAEGVTLPHSDKTEKRFLNHVQLEELADRCGDHYRLMVLFLGYTGLRWGEMAALRAGRIDLDRRRAAIVESVTLVRGKPTWGSVKTYERRDVPIPPFLIPDLRRHLAGLAGDELVFRGMRGALTQSQKFQNAALTAASKAMGLCDWVPDPCRQDPGRVTAVNVFHPHELRHTAASLAIASGADIKVVQQMLGHKSATMTWDLYGHLFPDRLDVVADAMDAARAAALAAQRAAVGSDVPPVFPQPQRGRAMLEVVK